MGFDVDDGPGENLDDKINRLILSRQFAYIWGQLSYPELVTHRLFDSIVYPSLIGKMRD